MVLTLPRLCELLEEAGAPEDRNMSAVWEAHGAEIVACAQQSSSRAKRIDIKRFDLCIHILNAFSKLWCTSLRCEMWEDVPCRGVLLHASLLTSDEAQEIREVALETLANFALVWYKDRPNGGIFLELKIAMWEHPACRRAIRDACIEGGLSGAFRALQNVLGVPLKQVRVVATIKAVWADKELRQAIIDASVSDHGDAGSRAYATTCLELIGSTMPNDVWAECSHSIIAGLRSPENHHTDDAIVCVHAICKSASTDLKSTLWDDGQLRQSLVDFLHVDVSERDFLVKHALQVLENLSSVTRIRAEMPLNRTLLDGVVKCCREPTETDVRNAAIKVLIEIAAFSSNKVVVWIAIFDVRQSLVNQASSTLHEALELFASLAQDPVVAANMVAETPALLDLARTHRRAVTNARALWNALPKQRERSIPTPNLSDLPSDSISRTLGQESRVASMREWIATAETVVTANQSKADELVTDATTKHRTGVLTALDAHHERVTSSMQELKKELNVVTSRKLSQMAGASHFLGKIRSQKLKLAEAKESLEEAELVMNLLEESKASGKRKATHASETNTRSKRGRMDAHTPPASASRRAPRTRPEDHFCPITLEVMRNPVVASDGVSYERTAITEWLATNGTSPLHGHALSNKTVFPNQALKRLIEGWVEDVDN